MLFARMSVSANQMGGVPCIRDLRIPVSTVVGMVAERMTDEEILRAYPDLEAEDIREALRYAPEAVREGERIDGAAMGHRCRGEAFASTR